MFFEQVAGAAQKPEIKHKAGKKYLRKYSLFCDDGLSRSRISSTRHHRSLQARVLVAVCWASSRSLRVTRQPRTLHLTSSAIFFSLSGYGITNVYYDFKDGSRTDVAGAKFTSKRRSASLWQELNMLGESTNRATQTVKASTSVVVQVSGSLVHLTLHNIHYAFIRDASEAV